MKFTISRIGALQGLSTTLLPLVIILVVLGLIPSLVSAKEGYTQGWLGAPDWVLDRMDTSIMPDLFIPKNLQESNDVPTVSSYLEDGNDFLISGSYNDAKNSFEKVIGLNHQSFDAWLGRGYALEGLTRYQSALESYEKAIVLSKNQEYAWAAYAGRGRVSLELQLYQVAERAFEKSIELFDGVGSGTNEDLINLYTGLLQAKQNLGDEIGAAAAEDMVKELNVGYN